MSNWESDMFPWCSYCCNNEQTVTVSSRSVPRSDFPDYACAVSNCVEYKFTREVIFFDRVPGEIKRSRDLRGGRWTWTLTFAQKRSWVGRWSWAEQVGRLLLRVVQVVRQQRCSGHCLSDSVQHSSWKSNCTVHKSLGNGEGTPP